MAIDLGSERPTTPSRRPLGMAMIGLALARGWHDGWAFAVYLGHHAARLIRSPSSVPWDEFAGVAVAAWPLLLGVALVRSRSSRPLKAATITALTMGLERVASLAIGGLFDSGWRALYRGGWDATRGPVAPRGWSLAAAVAIGLAWLVLGGWAWRMGRADRVGARAAAPVSGGSRRRARPLYTNIAAAAFASAIVMMTGWGMYLTVLDRLPWVRTLVLGNDRRNGNRPFVAIDTPEGRRLREADLLFAEAQNQQGRGEFREARQRYIKATNRYESLMEEFPKRRLYRRQFALAANNLAWFLATCPEPSIREPETAVVLARKALTAVPDDGNTLNTLAVAHFRAGELANARDAFERSMALREGGDSFDWFFLAQIDAAQGKPDDARVQYDKAVAWMNEHRAREPELFRFRVEAADRLKLPRPELPEVDPSQPKGGARPILLDARRRRQGGD